MSLFVAESSNQNAAVFECDVTTHWRRDLDGQYLLATNHRIGASESNASAAEESVSRYHLAQSRLLSLQSQPQLSHTDLIAILASEGIERRDRLCTVFSNVVCLNQKRVWYTFGGYPAASHGDWQEITWPW